MSPADRSFRLAKRAKVFDSYEDVLDAIFTDKPKLIRAGDVTVCGYEEPRGGPAMAEILMVIYSLIAAGKKDIAVITEGRFSGLTRDYPAIGHVCPEAQWGGLSRSFRTEISFVSTCRRENSI